MRSFGANNWIKYGWGPNLEDKFCNEPLVIDLSSYMEPEQPISPIDAAVNAVHKIAETYPAPYTLMSSGGVDSQCMIWAWHLSGVPFNVTSVRYVSEGVWFNEHDLVQLAEFSDMHKILVKYLDFDIINFLENDLPAVATTYDCDSPQLSTHIKMTELVSEGTILFGGNYIHPNGTMCSNTLLGLQRYADSINDPNRAVIPFFLLHDPVLAYSFLPLHIAEKNSFHCIEETSVIYQRAGFPVIPQSQKFNGFEQVKIHYDDDKYNVRISPKTRLQYCKHPSKRKFDLLFRYPYHKHTFDMNSSVVQFKMKKYDKLPN